MQISEAYTDNVSLAPPGREEEDFITQIAPSISYARLAPRLDLMLDYQFEYLWYANDSDRNETFHQAEAIGQVVAVPEWFFVRAGGSYSQQIISPADPVSVNNLSVTGNRTDVSSLTFNPYLEHRFNDRLTVRAEHQVSEIDYERSRLSDSERRYSLLRFGNDAEAKYRWRLSASQRVYEVDELEDTVLKRWSALIGRRFSSRLAFDIEAGQEDNEYGGAVGTVDEDGGFWFIRSSWDPTAHTSVEAAYGNRVFGSTGSLSVTSRSVLGEVRVAYSEEFTSDIESLTVLDADTTEIGETFLATTTATDTEVYLARSLRARWSRARGRSEFGVWAYRERREFQQTGDEEQLDGLGGRWGWQMTPRTTLIVEGENQERDFRGLDRTDQTWFTAVGAERRITPRITGALRYRYTERDSDAIFADYEQNMVILTARAEF